MAALIGLLVGALAGHAVWGKWGAIVGGLAGFFAGAMFLGKRAREVYRKPGALVAGAPVAATAAGDATLIERVAKLEARIAVLERAQGQVAPGDASPEIAASAVVPHSAPPEIPANVAAPPDVAMPTPDVPAAEPIPSSAIPAPEVYTQASAASAAPVACASRQSGVGVVHRRQCAHANRRRRAVLRRRVPASLFCRALHRADRSAAGRRCRRGRRLDRARNPPRGVAARIRAVASGCRRRHPLPHRVRCVPAVFGTAGRGGDGAADRHCGTDRLARRRARTRRHLPVSRWPAAFSRRC